MKHTAPILLAALLAAFNPAASAERKPAMTYPIIDTAYWTEQPYCSGRY